MRLLDRTLFFAYIRAYLYVLVSLLSLYVILDLFTNIEDFAQHVHGLPAVVEHIARYYGYRVLQYFDRLCEAITLLAAMFTVAWMQRNNELLPLLSAGVPTRRVIRPVLLGAGFMLGLGIANQEFAIPRIADALLADRDDPAGDKSLPVQGAFEPNGVHIEGTKATRRSGSITPLYITFPEQMTGGLVHMTVEQAYYSPPDNGGKHAGGWLLTGAVPATLNPCPPVLEQIDPGNYFLHVQEVDFDALDSQEQLVYVHVDRQAPGPVVPTRRQAASGGGRAIPYAANAAHPRPTARASGSFADSARSKSQCLHRHGTLFDHVCTVLRGHFCLQTIGRWRVHRARTRRVVAGPRFWSPRLRLV